ncbi:recombinase-domain-containing protein [Piromyces finnis]|uniref:Recombinase-domain-containing protein n=1 Tax=Piromyces finnis TaxID=1754191 RepID=A0A1Y1VN52_9FUNG|nr:recombinase-domain-containing protein [Piromyces finnis]|eukprot:ORX60199.1 recombinase-domain-containing protein [Piromyces finnis]
MSGGMNINNPEQFSVGVYVCKSENEFGTDIPGQIQIVENFCGVKSLHIVDYYIDSNNDDKIELLERAAIKRLINDISEDKINMIIVKDLDALSTDYKKVKKIIPILLSKPNSRFISIENEIMIGSNSLKEINDKIKAKVRRRKYRMGGRLKPNVILKKVYSAPHTDNVICRPPFGYLLKPDSKNEFIIDRPAADIVVEIFAKIIEGYSYQKIANSFNERGILTVSQYAEKMGRNPRKISTQWNTSTIYQIATNEIYLGHLVKSNFGRPTYKSKNQKKTEKVIYYNAHEPIIDEQTFKMAQNITHGRTKSTTQKVLNTRRAPFGYDTDVSNNNKFVIDPEAAAVVRTIFNRIIQGFFYYQIADEFNSNGVLTISQYEDKKGKKQRKISTKWNTSTIYKLVRNEVYLGHLVKIKKIIDDVDGSIKKEKIVIRNTHEPIISEDVFKLVQKIIRNKHSTNVSEGSETEKSEM